MPIKISDLLDGKPMPGMDQHFKNPGEIIKCQISCCVEHGLHRVKGNLWKAVRDNQGIFESSLAKIHLETSDISSKILAESQAIEANWKALAKKLKGMQTEQASLKKDIEELKEKYQSALHEYHKEQKKKCLDFQELCTDVANIKRNFEDYQNKESFKFEAMQEQCKDWQSKVEERLTLAAHVVLKHRG
ncbi:uncharacterized protein MELLADRAFT_102961 [Melampsora larici-populina 98AG31]|uniref:Uncharacterized protein n=1 Tax=Melampsora larici-populina (strain 98AG31 / pathotype 3-4-7) TaxID=747676 RepID=F4R8Q8_MELLP|nr:uncharacterized protein MELLADRAFT_102961 [Melampsora larici-populina 98AG31]EGG11067.1 hypothetical protein MELLADRAFT_102961 [Melampsora larici-populina 98AG31]